MTDQAEIAAGADVLDRSLLDGRSFQHAAHFEIVGDNQAAVADLLAQNVGDPLLGERCRASVVRNRGIVGVSDQDHGHLTAQGPVGIQVLCPDLFPRLVDRREFLMSIEIGFAQAGKVLGLNRPHWPRAIP